MGHLWGPMELVSGATSPSEVVEALVEGGFLVEGETTYEVTETGKSARTTVRFRPREGLFAKLLARINVTLSASPKDFM